MSLKRYLFFIFAVASLISLSVSGQTLSGMHVSASEKKQLEKQQDSLMRFAFYIVNASEANQRFRADSTFIRMLVRSLKIPNSFYFPFDSLQTISKLYSPDSSFRIFTWQ